MLTRLIKSMFIASMSLLSAAEAAARLGVKKETLYAYVSRGLIQPIREDGSRLSRFASRDVDQLRSRRRRRPQGELDTVVSTGLTLVEDGNLRIRGVDLVAAVRAGASFEVVADLLWGDSGAPDTHWPEPDISVRGVVRNAVRGLPDSAPPLDRLRTAVCALSANDPLRAHVSHQAGVLAGRGLVAALPLAMDPTGGPATEERTVAARLWCRLTSDAQSPPRLRALDGALALLADHGLATSTFAARVAASVRADVYSMVLAGMGAVAGALHGGASGRVRTLLELAHATNDAARAVEETLASSGALPGFGHGVYREGDPRQDALMRMIREAWPDDGRADVAWALKDLVEQGTGHRANVDYGLGVLIWLAGMRRGSGEAIFAIARTAGWIAHGLEEWQETPLRFRPRARYVGVREADFPMA